MFSYRDGASRLAVAGVWGAAMPCGWTVAWGLGGALPDRLTRGSVTGRTSGGTIAPDAALVLTGGWSMPCCLYGWRRRQRLEPK